MLLNMGGGKREEIIEIVNPTLLWENTDDMSASTYTFPEQIIEFNKNSSAYYIELAYNGTMAATDKDIFYLPVGTENTYITALYSKANKGIRRINTVNSNSIDFGAGFSGSNRSMGRGIPLRIWGVEYVI